MGPKALLEWHLKIVKFLQMHVFSGGSSSEGYRHAQLLRCVWNGPGSDALLYMSEMYEGSEFVIKAGNGYKRGYLRSMRLMFRRSFFGINDFAMLNALSDQVSNFVSLLISLAEFRQCPSRLTDMIMFLA